MRLEILTPREIKVTSSTPREIKVTSSTPREIKVTSSKEMWLQKQGGLWPVGRNQTDGSGIEDTRQRGCCDQRGREQVVSVGSANPPVWQEGGVWHGNHGRAAQAQGIGTAGHRSKPAALSSSAPFHSQDAWEQCINFSMRMLILSFFLKF